MSETGPKKGETATSYKIPVFRIRLVKEAEAEGRPVTNAQDVVTQMQDLALADREHIVCLHLNTKNRPIGRQTVSIGTLNQSVIHPREVYKGAILSNASRILLVHNHPSGDPTPSRDDDALTRRLARAGVLLGMPILDHVIVCPNGAFFSYQEGRSELLKGG